MYRRPEALSKEQSALHFDRYPVFLRRHATITFIAQYRVRK
jgi:hypothetical protein